MNEIFQQKANVDHFEINRTLVTYQLFPES